MKANKKIIKIIVNTLSASRVIGALLMPIFFHNMSILGLIILLACLFITDAIDGKMARKFEAQTRGGALLDPLGDKMLAISCILSLIKSDKLLIIVLLLEIAITIINIIRTLHDEKTKTSIIGKIKTALISVTLVICSINVLNKDLLTNTIVKLFPMSNLNLTITNRFSRICIIMTIVAQILTALGYLKESYKQRNTRIKKVPKLKNFKSMMKSLFDEDAFLEDKNKSLITIIKK